MKTLADVPGQSLGGTGRRHFAGGEAHPTAAEGLAGRPAAEPAGSLVANRYRIRSLLGRGGMGQVWLANDGVLHRPVALKQVLLNGLGSAEVRTAAWACAIREARAAARVDHIGAVRIHDIVEQHRWPWIVMEPLRGRTLQEALNAAGPLSAGQVTRIGLCLLDVLQVTHRAGIVHRDVKPGNVYLCGGGRVVLTDFGIACSIDDCASDNAASETGTIVGSPPYVSPERLDGEYGPASDLFSLGATLFAAVEGRPPFDRGSLLPTLAAIAKDVPAPFLRAGPLRPVIEGLLAKDPQRRLITDQARAALRDIRCEPGWHAGPRGAGRRRTRSAPQQDRRPPARRHQRAARRCCSGPSSTGAIIESPRGPPPSAATVRADFPPGTESRIADFT